MSYEEIIERLIDAQAVKDGKLAKRFKLNLQKDADLIQIIMDATCFLQYNAPLQARVYCILQNITEQPVCAACGRVVQMRLNGRFRCTFPTFHSQRCMAKSPVVIRKRQQTVIRKFGSTNVLTSEYGKEKIRQSNLEKFGVENPSKNREVREKMEATNMERYGTKHSCMNEEVKKKKKKTMIERYGVENFFSLDQD